MFNGVFYTEYNQKRQTTGKKRSREIESFQGEKLYQKKLSLGWVSVDSLRQSWEAFFEMETINFISTLLDDRPKKKAMFPPYRPGETFFLLTRAREKSTIPFFPFTLKFLFYFLRYSH